MALGLIIVLSVLAQLSAAILALRLIPLTGRRRAWTLLAAAILLMTVRRVITMGRFAAGAAATAPDVAFELVGLVISVLALAGIAGIAPLFRSLRETQEALGRSERRYRRIVETAHEGIAAFDAGGKIVFANERLAGMLGYGVAEEIGRSYRDFVFPEDAPLADGIFERHLKGSREQFDFRLRRRDGSPLWTIVSGSPVADGNGIVGVLAMFSDLSDRKRMEAERETLIGELQEALGRIRTLSGLLPICASCKKIRDDAGSWHPLESYITHHSEAEFSHGLCPGCAHRLYPGLGE